MTDKELFEKTEKVFNLNKKNPIIENVYKKGNFKQTLLEWRRSSTSPIRSNYGDNTVVCYALGYSFNADGTQVVRYYTG